MNSESNTTPANAAQPKGKAWYSQSAEEVLTQLGSSASVLSAQETAKRLEADGPNELKEGKRINPLQIFIGQFKSLIIWILIVAGIISGVLGETVDAIAILAIVVLNAIIGFYQEFSAEKSIAALKNMTAPQAKVRRDGQVISIPAVGIVTGDILCLDSDRFGDARWRFGSCALLFLTVTHTRLDTCDRCTSRRLRWRVIWLGITR